MKEEWRPLVGYEGLYEVSNMGRVKSLERTVWNEKEIWKPIEGYENLYEVSNLGRIKSLERMKWNGRGYQKIPERIIKPQKNSKGYLQLQLSKDGKAKGYLVHQLVATAFCENPHGFKEVNHIDEDKTNNNADNLEWCSRSYNCNYGTRNQKLSKPVLGINKINGLILEFPSAMEASRQTGIDQGNITQCCKGKYKSMGGFYWYYADIEE